mgnify:FL=1
MATSDHLVNAVPAFGNPNYKGIGDGVVLATNASFESAQAGVVPYQSWTELDADLFAENELDWVVEDVSTETNRKVGRPKKSV